MEQRSYHQYCGLAKALDIVGERWTMLIIRNLLLGSQRYSELLRNLPGITTNLLAKRLKAMEEGGMIERVKSTVVEGGHSYRLTKLGAQLEPAVHALGSWGWQWMDGPKRGDFRSVEFLFVALRRRYLGGARLNVEILADGIPYRFALTPRKADIGRGEFASPDLRIVGAGPAIATMFLDRRGDGRLPTEIKIDGLVADFRSFLGSFAAGDDKGADL